MLMGRDGKLRVQPLRIFCQLRDIAGTGQRDDIIGVGRARDQINGVLPDRARGPENTDFLHMVKISLARG